MNCVEWETRVALHAGGDLTGAEALEVERHLGECPGCQAFWSELRTTLADLRTAHADVPAAAHFTAVRSRVMAELHRGQRPWRRLAWISRLLASIPPEREPVPVAPVVRHAARHVAHPAVRHAVEHTPPRAPLAIKLQTDDPNIVIYWIAD